MIRRLLALAAAGVALVAAGCTPTVHLEPAAHANDPRCADVTVRVPDAIADFDRVWTDAQATAAWGDPSAVLFTCGLEPPGPSTLQCVSIGGVDWIVDDSDFPNLRLTTYGRTPAAQAYVDTEAVSSNDVLSSLSNAVATLPENTRCTTVEDAEMIDEDVPQTS
ncbi:hypothetical protein GCM10010915_17340 [Microbacterium faecale]|uniref:DUF3515 domain-containing protein n=1 Tax=Microbacterium faecale TaxID=1804630 RepID=A0A917DGT1_9MICO|nr:DUF3515 family protein [Microbacterium faecale]GGD37081.1 hypothetical protein GCM10010915_17340 [Microbacterium faecale]